MMAPIYRDLVPEQIPQWELAGGITLRMIAGTINSSHEGTLTEFKGAVERPDTEPVFSDIHFARAGAIRLVIPESHNAFVYTYRGEVCIGDGGDVSLVGDTKMAVLTNMAGANTVQLSATGASRCILVAGRPLNEPIAQHGPFVMNSREELVKAFSDYQAGLIRA